MANMPNRHQSDKDITNQVRRGSSEMLTGSRATGSEMRHLMETSLRTKAGMAEIATSSEAMTEAISQVFETIGSNEVLASDLSRQMDSFLVDAETTGCRDTNETPVPNLPVA